MKLIWIELKKRSIIIEGNDKILILHISVSHLKQS